MLCYVLCFLFYCQTVLFHCCVFVFVCVFVVLGFCSPSFSFSASYSLCALPLPAEHHTALHCVCFVLPIILLNCLFDCCVFVFVCALFTCSPSFSFPVACMSHSLCALPFLAEHHNASCGVVFYFVLPILLPNCLFDWCVFEFVVCLLFSVLPSHIIDPRCPWDAKFLPMGLS